MNLSRKSDIDEPQERKALMSKIVVPETKKSETKKRQNPTSMDNRPKRLNLSLVSIINLLIQIMLLGLGTCENLQEGNSVLWRKNGMPAVIGYNSVNLRINLISPCKLLPLDGLPSTVVVKLKKQCNEQYQHLFLSELERMCPEERQINPGTDGLARKKRAIFAIAAVVIIAVTACAGVGMSGYAIHKTDQLEIAQSEIRRTLDDLEAKVQINSENIQILQQEMKKMAVSVNKLISDVNSFKEKAIEIQYLIAYIASRLVYGRGVIQETRRKWKKKTMEESFFEFLNFTLPCGDNCPLEYGEPRKCSLDKNRDTISMEFTVPIVNQNLTIVESDAFFLMVKENGKTCKIIYTGPQNAMVSEIEDCVYATDMKLAYRGRFLQSSSKTCSNKTSFREKRHYKMHDCEDSKKGDEVHFLQVKAYNNKYYVYCPGLELHLGTTRIIKCPNKVFMLPLTATFTLNGVTYYGRLLNLIYNEAEDPLYIEKLEWHLTPSINWDELNKTFPILKALDKDHWNIHNNYISWINIGIMCTVGAILVCCFVWKNKCKICRTLLQRKVKTKDKRIELPTTPEEITEGEELMETKHFDVRTQAESSEEESIIG